jgi:PAS domain S-box-containing protein
LYLQKLIMDASKFSSTRLKFPSDVSVRGRGTFIISIPVICLLASILMIAALRSRTIAVRQQEQQSQKTVTDTSNLLRELIDAETGVRGYVITRRPEFLKPYLQAKDLLPQSLDALYAQVKNHPARRQQFQEIPSLVRQQLQLLEQTLEMSDREGATVGGSALITERLQESRLNMDELRQEISQFYEQEKRWQSDRQAQAFRWARVTTIVQWSCLAVGLLGSGAALYLFNQLDQERHQQASSLRTTNLYLQAVFDNVVDGIIIINSRGYIQSANAATGEIFGYERSELQGVHLQRLMAEQFAEDSGQAMKSLVGKNQDKLRLQQETVGRQKSGQIFPMEFALSEMQLDNEHLFIAIVRDITERKQSQETLLKQAQLLNLANDTIIVRDLNDTITYWNQGAQRLYGFSPAEAVGQCSHTLLKTEFPQPPEEIQEALFKQGYWSGELVHSRRDGSRVFVKSGWTLQRDETGMPLAFLEINQDITERKQAEAALRKSEELYRTLVKNFPNGGVFLFDEQMRYSIAEGTGLASVNLNSESLTGKTIWETLPQKRLKS